MNEDIRSAKTYKEFPPPISFRKLIGPSFIILALGLGSGEVILWPYLVSNYGLGLAWGAILGITFQFFINMEIERYALAKGESVFVGMHRFWPKAAYWFILSTFIGFGLPGIIAASAQVMANVFGIADFKYLAVLFLLLIGFVLSVGKTVYGLMEKLTKTIILIGVPFIFILAVVLSRQADWLALARGLAGLGEGYLFLPAGISLAAFLAAFAYSGAGGNLNLTQSIYVKEKGYGMGKYSQRISGLFGAGGGGREIKLAGEEFVLNEKNLNFFRRWWRRVNWEHLLVFWLVGSLSMLFLMILAQATVYGAAGNTQGINFVIGEGAAMAAKLSFWVGPLFLIIVSVMLFQTQLGIMDSTSRIMAENFALKKLGRRAEGKINLSGIYFVFVWAQIFFGIILFLFDIYEPRRLIVLGAVINALAMFVHIGLVNRLNRRALPPPLRPGWIRKTIILLIFVFFGVFTLLVIGDKLFSYGLS